MKYFVDIDNTICYYKNTNCKDYNLAIPYYNRINKINELYEQGNEITYWTARGTLTGINWYNTTHKQLDQWKCKYHELRMGKPAYDIFIDDKNINSETFFKDVESIPDTKIKVRLDNNLKILCIIPARSGSKSLPHKNIKNFNGKPLMAWSIEQSKECKYKNQIKIVVSTDSEKYRDIAVKWGAEVPFIRPQEISGDLSTDYECIKHAVIWLSENENYKPDIILQLRPTQPCRKVEDINKCLELFLENRNNYDSLRTVVEFEKSPYKMYTIHSNNELQPLHKKVNVIKEPYNQSRQVLPKTYLHNGYIDIFNTEILEKETISGDKIYPYIMNKNDTIDIDTIDDWEKAEMFFCA